MKRFNDWLDTFVAEKGSDMEAYLDTYRGDKWRAVPVSFVIEHVKIASDNEKAAIKNTLVMIDFKNGDVLHYFAHLGAALWEAMDEYLGVI